MNPLTILLTLGAVAISATIAVGGVWWLFSKSCPYCGNLDIDDRDDICICKKCLSVWDKNDADKPKEV